MPLQYARTSPFGIVRSCGRMVAPTQEMLDWWKGVFAKLACARQGSTCDKLFASGARSAGKPPTQGITMADRRRTGGATPDTIARRARSDAFRHQAPACFPEKALLAHTGGKSTVVIGTSFSGRQRSETSEHSRDVQQPRAARRALSKRRQPAGMGEICQGQFSSRQRSMPDLPVETLFASLHQSGLRPPPIKVLFTMASDWSEQKDWWHHHQASAASGIAGNAIRGFQMYVDSENAVPLPHRSSIRAAIAPDDVKSFAESYERLLKAAADPSICRSGNLRSPYGASKKLRRHDCEGAADVCSSFIEPVS